MTTKVSKDILSADFLKLDMTIAVDIYYKTLKKTQNDKE